MSPRANILIARGRRRFLALLQLTGSMRARVGTPRSIIGALGGATGVLALTTFVGILVRTINSLVLTRLLTPSVFGVVGIIGSIFFTLAMITDLGFESFVVRHARGNQRHFLDVIWTVHAIRGIALAFLGCVLAPVIGWLLRKNQIVLPLAVASLTLAISGFASFSLIVALKLGNSRKLSILEMYLGIFQTLFCICLAILLRNIWAFVLAMIAQSLLRTVLSYTLFHESTHRFTFDRSIRVEFFAFSRVVVASSLLTLLISQSDKLLLAKVFTLEEFGLYTVALNLVSVPVSFVGAYVSRIVFPKYTKTWLSDPSEIGAVYYGALRRTAPLYSVAVGCLIGGASLLIAILYDKRYQDSAIYLSLLAIGAALRLPTFAAAEMMTAIGRIKVTLYLNIIRVGWLLVAAPIGYWVHGALGIILGVGLLEVPALVYSWVWLRKAGILNMRREIEYLSFLLGGVIVGIFASKVGLHLLGR